MANLHSFGGLSCLSRGRVGVACTDAGPVDGVQSFGLTREDVDGAQEPMEECPLLRCPNYKRSDGEGLATFRFGRHKSASHFGSRLSITSEYSRSGCKRSQGRDQEAAELHFSGSGFRAEIQVLSGLASCPMAEVPILQSLV